MVPESYSAQGDGSPDPRKFLPTRWSLVLEARSDDPDRSAAALSELCQRYWYPLYAFARLLGKPPEEAEDLTQGCFLELLRHETFTRADSQKGKLRTFLLKALKDHIFRQDDRARAVKRGGQATIFSLDVEWAEGVMESELIDPAAGLDREFERRWAMTVISTVMDRLRSEYQERGRESLFLQLAPCLVQASHRTYATIAKDLAMSEGAVKVAVHRMRRRFQEMFRNEIADTLAEGEDVDAELSAMMEALS